MMHPRSGLSLSLTDPDHSLSWQVLAQGLPGGGEEPQLAVGERGDGRRPLAAAHPEGLLPRWGPRGGRLGGSEAEGGGGRGRLEGGGESADGGAGAEGRRGGAELGGQGDEAAHRDGHRPDLRGGRIRPHQRLERQGGRAHRLGDRGCHSKSLVHDLVYQESRRVVQELLTRALRGEEDKNIEIKMMRFGQPLKANDHQKQPAFVVVNACSSRDYTNAVVGVCFVGQDVTGQRTAMDNFVHIQGDYKAIVHSPSPLIPPIFASDDNAYCSEWNAAM